MKHINYTDELLSKVFFKLIELAATRLPIDIQLELENIYKQETDSLAKLQLETILENLEIARKEKKPICQDTGIISFQILYGKNGPKLDIFRIKDILINIVKKATNEIPLRPNAVELFKGNTGNNIGKYIPWFYYEFIENRDYHEIIAFLKGGGCSNVSALKMLNPGVGIKGIINEIIDSTIKAGGKGCPPYIIGIGIGGGEDIAMILAKKALMIPCNEYNKEPEIAELEIKLKNAINDLGIGIMGLGSGKTVIDLHILNAARHPASLPLAISFNCWALRYSIVKLYNDKIIYPSHKEEYIVEGL